MAPMMKLKKALRAYAPIELSWSHDGALWRVTSWPEAQFERQDEGRWTAAAPDEGAYFSAAQSLGAADWQKYLEFVPTPERAFLHQFKAGRLAALQLLARCPDLLLTLAETPALVPYAANHVALCGTEVPSWGAVAAVHERGGVYELMRWLGLPASRQTLTILRNVANPDIPLRLLEPLRSMLWEPTSLGTLERRAAISDRQLAYFCHALAA